MADLLEHAAKSLLSEAGISVPESDLAMTAQEASKIAERIGPCVVKAQVPTGRRGKAGGVKFAATADAAESAATDILGMRIDEHLCEHVLIEQAMHPLEECYAAVMNDPKTRTPMMLFSKLGGVDVEESMKQDPASVRHFGVEPSIGFGHAVALQELAGLDLAGAESNVANALVGLYDMFRKFDADLLEINPLAVLADKSICALDCKFSLDDAALVRQAKIADLAVPELQTGLEQRAAAAGLKYIDLGGDIGVLANGAGLTMTTIDVIAHFGGSAANFLEIGGEAYSSAGTAVNILLANPRIRSLVVNFCGAFARTDVMAQGFATAWNTVKPDLPVFFSIHGTGENEAVALVRAELGVEPYKDMNDAVKAAILVAGSR